MAHWRDTMRPARFFTLDARAGFVVLLALMHLRWWTLLIVAATLALFWWLERRGMPFEAALRGLRAFFAGDARPALRRIKTRHRVDYARRG